MFRIIAGLLVVVGIVIAWFAFKMSIALPGAAVGNLPLMAERQNYLLATTVLVLAGTMLLAADLVRGGSPLVPLSHLIAPPGSASRTFVIRGAQFSYSWIVKLLMRTAVFLALFMVLIIMSFIVELLYSASKPLPPDLPPMTYFERARSDILYFSNLNGEQRFIELESSQWASAGLQRFDDSAKAIGFVNSIPTLRYVNILLWRIPDMSELTAATIVCEWAHRPTMTAKTMLQSAADLANKHKSAYAAAADVNPSLFSKTCSIRQVLDIP